MTLADREELRRVGREFSATVGVVCPFHVNAAFDFELGKIDIYIYVPLEKLLVEASKEILCWRVMVTPVPRAAREPDSQSTLGWRDRVMPRGTHLTGISATTPQSATSVIPRPD